MRIICEMVDYVTGSRTSESLVETEYALGRNDLVPLLNQLLGCLRLPDVLMPVELEEMGPIETKLKTLFNCCPELKSVFTMCDRQLMLSDVLSPQEIADIVVMLRTRLGVSSLIV